MAQQSVDQLAKALVDTTRREVVWPMVFSGIKNIVRTNNLNTETLSCIKTWLKTNDSQLHTPLLSLTVMHTMSLNCSQFVRNQLAAPKLFQRLEKQLAKPQGPQVATAIVQVLVDWAHLYGHEELGARSRAVLAQPRYSQMAVGYAPSPAVVSMEEEMRLGLPPVAPIRGEDFISWLYRGASRDGSARGAGGAAAPAAGSPSPSAPGGQQQQQQGYVPGGAPPPITSQEAPQLCRRMRADAERLTSALAACRSAAGRSQRVEQLLGPMDAAYREAERCSQWRRRVQEFAARRADDPAALSSLLSATDVINQALQLWQDFTGREVFAAMRITVPPMPPEHLQQQQQPNGGAGGSGAAAGGGGGGGAATLALDELFNHVAPAASQQQQPVAVAVVAAGAAGGFPAPSTNPFAAPPPPSASSGSAAAGAAAAAVVSGPPHSGSLPPRGQSSAHTHTQPHHQANPSFSEWDPFAMPAPQRQPPAATAAGTAAAANGTAAPTAPAATAAAANTGWTHFSSDTGNPPTALQATGSSRSPSPAPYSPGQSSPQTRSGGVQHSPSATANSSTSVTSTPNGLASARAVPSPANATTPQHPTAASSSYQAPAGTSTASASHAHASGSSRPDSSKHAAAPAPVHANGSGSSNANTTLDWMPLFERLASDLRTLSSSTSSSSGTAAPDATAAAAGPPLAAVLPRVRQLCEALAEQHSARVAELTAAHAAELRDARMQAALMANVRQVTSSPSSSSSTLAGAGGTGNTAGKNGGGSGVPMAAAAAAGGGGSAHARSLHGSGAGVANGFSPPPQHLQSQPAILGAGQLGPLQAGLQLHQQPPPLPPLFQGAPQLQSSMAALSLSGSKQASANGKGSNSSSAAPADFSLI
ncbi:hypothetical protein Agub_g2326 [Astrephomene gubernaculifera]|uniref:VHS domain-containing protein n=1 Tax=Astrephomene gubernaculifera TaxID=47775 RepID=A0AAD3HI08_9CHLO|nr:hypothetical protein Agub_g2326 [Astrephomene gubernaculifera]